MREPNISYMSHSRPAVCITSGVYDRRALDCTATVPLINSLTHLAYLTSTSPRIREILVTDGGLERLVRILSTFDLPNDRRHLWKWSLAFQCVVNIGVRGTERIRTRVVEAGAVHIVTRVLENFLRAVDLARQQNLSQHKRDLQPIIVLSPATSRGYSVLHHPPPPADTIAHMLSMPSSSESPTSPPTRTSTKTSSTTTASSIQSSSSSSNNDNNNTNNTNNDHSYRIPSTTTASISYNNNNNNTIHDTSSILNSNNNYYHNKKDEVFHRTNGQRIIRHISTTMHRRSTFPYIKIDATQRRRHRLIRVPTNPVSVWRDPRTSNIDNLFYREEDILLSLQLLAYLSKYPHIRNVFHAAYDMNVFSLVERFCHWLHAQQVQYWAGVIMRNACRKDETQGGIRRCANMHCGKWEKQQREFAKCRRCRKAKYCSKACQSRAWAEGHRWWCVERSESTNANTNTAASVSSTNATVGTTPPPTTATAMTGATTPTNTVGGATVTTNNIIPAANTTMTTHGMTTTTVTTTTVPDNGVDVHGIETGDQQQQQQSPAMMNTTSGIVTEDDTVQAMVEATATRTIL